MLGNKLGITDRILLARTIMTLMTCHEADNSWQQLNEIAHYRHEKNTKKVIIFQVLYGGVKAILRPISGKKKESKKTKAGNSLRTLALRVTKCSLLKKNDNGV